MLSQVTLFVYLRMMNLLLDFLLGHSWDILVLLLFAKRLVGYFNFNKMELCYLRNMQGIGPSVTDISSSEYGTKY